MTTILKNVNKSFGDFLALDDINLKIEKGEFIAVLGPSGCGKTTLLRLLAGFESLNDGVIYIDNELVSSQTLTVSPENRNVNMVFQNYALWPHMTISEQIEYPLNYDKFASNDLKANSQQRVEDLLKIVNLSGYEKRYPHEISGGQRQRVALARSVATEPAILLMDEPLSALDAELRIEMRTEIEKMHKITGSTIIYVTHDQSEALAMADRIVVMNKGKIEQVGTPEEIYYYPRSTFVATFVGKANIFSGQWKNNSFYLDNSKVIWPNSKMNEHLLKENSYAIRPEELKLINQPVEGLSLLGKIISQQFEGMHYQYVVQVGQGRVIITTENSQHLERGQEVHIIPKELKY